MRSSTLALCLLALWPSLAGAVDAGPIIRGHVQVVDGDTLRMDRRKLRLHGVDAPEATQRCKRPDEQSLAIGREATRALQALVAQQEVFCRVLDTDRYKRAVVRCYAAGQDIGEAMVRSGWARAYAQYSARYLPLEAGAQADVAGVWACATEVAPWAHRKARSAPEASR